MAQYQPDAPTLLAAVADLLDQMTDDVDSVNRHQIRVAAHLVRLIKRELEQGTETEAEELVALRGLVDDRSMGIEQATARVCELLGSDGSGVFAQRAWPVLVEITRADLAIAKPGYTQWTGT